MQQKMRKLHERHYNEAWESCKKSGITDEEADETNKITQRRWVFQTLLSLGTKTWNQAQTDKIALKDICIMWIVYALFLSRQVQSR